MATGLVRLSEYAPEARFLPMAIEYPFWSERAAEMLCGFGAALDGATLAAMDRAARGEALARALESTMDRLAVDAMARDPGRFCPLLRGREGMGGIYERWRRLKAVARGRSFDPRHDPTVGDAYELGGAKNSQKEMGLDACVQPGGLPSPRPAAVIDWTWLSLGLAALPAALGVSNLRRLPSLQADTAEGLVSVLIPARDEAANIESCLAAVLVCAASRARHDAPCAASRAALSATRAPAHLSRRRGGERALGSAGAWVDPEHA
jgi:hypothetical protein